ncbi:ribbon-helix-helix protein, CopG family [Candidatus Azambacteria bacterium]|nr:ribbon-helix-helix protein, CopG family [Candidatus Azambacteria bacterium]
MRTVINISLPKKMTEEVEKAVKSGGYASKSEFFRDMIRRWREEQLLEEIMESEKEFAAGKGKVLHSLKDLR